jgi:murein tripeptide amidase MpaA
LHKATLKIVPMMNPDGVFIGNYRTGIAGKDYNRNFNSGKADLFPEIEALKKLVDELQKQGEVLAFIDLHGHSILRNSFIFGPGPTTFGSNQRTALMT